MPFTLPELPWEKDSLSPHISSETIDFHYGKHHKAYVDKLNAAIEGTDKENQSLEEIIKSSEGGLFNNSAQVWNHTFYWNSLSPNGGGEPTGTIAVKINQDFGSFENFKKEFTNAAATNFASGWTWLVNDGGKLKIVNTDDAETPLTTDVTPLLTIDVWEHAYYVDYRNARPSYIEAFFKLVNWEFANKNLEN